MSGPFSAADEQWLESVEAAVDESAPVLLDAPVRLGLRTRTLGPDRRAHDLDEHLTVYGPRPDARGRGGRDLLAALEGVSLTGRGGGHFPAARKWHASIGAGGGGIVVANCAEGEPASAKDATLLQLRPHLLLDGLELAAETVDAPRAVVYLHHGDRAGLESVRTALRDRRSGGGARVDIRIAQGPDHYLTGESSAVVRALSGGPALPHPSRRPSAVSGIAGRPTLVHNTETLARVALVARAGPGAELEGPLLTVVGPESRCVLVAQDGETFRRLLPRSGVVTGDEPQAVLVGGYGGSWLPWREVASVEVSLAGVGRLGASIGAGVVAPVDARTCGLAETSALLSFLASASARQCGPCLFGLPALAELFARLAVVRAARPTCGASSGTRVRFPAGAPATIPTALCGWLCRPCARSGRTLTCI